MRVIKEDSDWEILERTYRTLLARGWDGKLGPPHPARARLAARLQLLRRALVLSGDNCNLAG